MEKHKKVLMFLVVLAFSICSEIVTVEVVSSSNGPNYWGDDYPGFIISDNYFENPTKPEFYVIKGIPDPEANDYDGSHYGTHDWLADAALRSLRDPKKNPLGCLDWGWLLNHDYSRRNNPQWQYNYENSDKHHYVIRSYITFLFATQMPDMDIRKYPNIQTIDIPREGFQVGDFSNLGDEGKWVGISKQHRYTFIPTYDLVTNSYTFPADVKLAAKKVEQLGRAATQAIAYTVKNEEGEEISAMKPETAAAWLGAMTHYFGDVYLPAHVLSPDRDVYDVDKYHKWMENNIAALTLWDTGPSTYYFDYDFTKLGSYIVIPLPPDIALAELAKYTISLAYRTDGNHQFIENEKVSGLYIKNDDKFWDWEDNIDFDNGRTTSKYGYFYNKIEILLQLAVYFTACAMQYCYNEAKKKTNDLDPSYYVEHPRDHLPIDRPTLDPREEREDISPTESSDNYASNIAIKFNDISKLISSIVLIGIPYVLQRTVEIEI